MGIGLIIQGGPVDENRPDVGAGKNPALNTHHREVLSREAFLPHLSRLHIHGAYPPVLVDLSAEPRPEINGSVQADPPRKKRANIVITEIGKQIPVFKEKLPPFWKEQLETVKVGDLP